MSHARRHQRPLSAAALVLLVLGSEVAGRSLTARVDVLLHVRDPFAANAAYYPFLLMGVKAGAALLSARLAWRFARAYATASAARQLLGARAAPAAPRMQLRLSPRLWAGAFASTALLYLVQADAERGALTLGPWLHTYSLPVFAVLAVVAALGWSVVSRWLADYESYAEQTVLRVTRLAAAIVQAAASHPAGDTRPPRARFGLAFESRPPPLAA